MEKEQTPEEGKMSPVKYYTIMRQSKDPKWLRYEIVRYARDNGVKPAARAFNTTPKTVRKWLRGWQPGSLWGLEDQRKLLRAKGLVLIQIKDKKLLN
jgi:transposase-like protein